MKQESGSPPESDPKPAPGAKQEPAAKPAQGDAVDPRVQEIIDAWAPVTNEPPERHDALFADTRFTRFLIHTERAIDADVPGGRHVRVSGGHYCIVIRDSRDGHENVGYLVDTHADPAVVQLDDLSSFLLDLAAGRIGEGAYILALRPRIGAAPAPRQAPVAHERRTYTAHHIGDQDLEFLDFRHNNCGAVATLGVGCLPPDDTYNLDRSPYHDIHRFLPALSATYTISAAYRAPPAAPVAPSAQGPDEAELRSAWEQFQKELEDRCDAISYEDFRISVIVSRQLAQQQSPAGSSSEGAAPVFVHRWGCVQLVLGADGFPAKMGEALERACQQAIDHAFPVAYRADKPVLEIDLASLSGQGLRLLAIPQSLFELILLTLRPSGAQGRRTYPRIDDHAPVVCFKEEVSLVGFTSIRRNEPIKLKNNAFVTYANQAVVRYLCAHRRDNRLPREVDVEEWLQITRTLLSEICKELQPDKHLKRVAEHYERELLSTICLEYEACGKTGPGFQLYRVTTEYTEDSSLRKYEISYGASLFGGWIFDGPTNGSKPACVMAYLMKRGKYHNYYVLRIPLEMWCRRGGFADECVRLKSLSLPPVPICLQIFGFKGGFHPRMASTQAAGMLELSPGKAIAFMRRFHRTYKPLPREYQPILSFPAVNAAKEKEKEKKEKEKEEENDKGKGKGKEDDGQKRAS